MLSCHSLLTAVVRETPLSTPVVTDGTSSTDVTSDTVLSTCQEQTMRVTVVWPWVFIYPSPILIVILFSCTILEVLIDCSRNRFKFRFLNCIAPFYRKFRLTLTFLYDYFVYLPSIILVQIVIFLNYFILFALFLCRLTTFPFIQRKSYNLQVPNSPYNEDVFI